MTNIKITKTQFKVLSVLITSAPGWALAEVDLLTGALLKEMQDPTLPAKARSRRNYSSRSMHRGIFGFGWCSDFEKKLEQGENSVTLHDCSAEQGVLFEQVSKNTYENADKSESIVRTPMGYEQYKQLKHHRSFDFNGQLTHLLTAAGWAQLKHDSHGRIKEVLLNKKTVSRWTWTSDGKKVSSIESNKGTSSHYNYTKENLTSVTGNDSKTSEIYSYDDQHNLLSSKEEAYQYNEALDTVVSIAKKNRCTEKYKYQKMDNLSQSTTATTSCPKESTKIRTAIFRFKQQQDGNDGQLISQIELLENKRIKVYQFSKSLSLAQKNNFDRRSISRVRIGGNNE